MLDKLLRSSLTLATGTMLGQVIVVLTSPLLTRLYTPAEFGEFSLYVISLYFIVAASSGRYDVAITVAKTFQDAIILARYSILFTSVTSILLLVAMCSSSIIFPINVLGVYKYLLPLGVFVTGLNTIFSNINLRRLQQNKIATSRTLQATITSLAQIVIGYTKAFPQGLVIGQIIGIVSSIMNLLAGRDFIGLIQLRNSDNLGAPDHILKRYISFPKFEIISALCVVFNNHIPTVIIGLMSSAMSAGGYALSQRIISTPLNIIAHSIASSTLAYGRNKSINKNSIIISSVVLFGEFIGLMAVLLGVVLIYSFGDIFGSEWQSTSVIAGWVCLSAGAKFKLDALFSLTTTNNLQREGLNIQLILATLKALPLLILMIATEVNIAIMAFSIINCIAHHFACRRIIKCIDPNISKYSFMILINFFSAIALLAAASLDYRLAIIIMLVAFIVLLGINIKSTHILLNSYK